MFAIDALVTDPRNLFGQTLYQPVVNVRRVNLLHARSGCILDPDFAGTVDHDLGHRIAFQPLLERG